MSLDIGNYTHQLVEIESKIPAWQAYPAQTQNLKVAIGQWGNVDAPAERTFVLVHGITANLEWWHTLAEALLKASQAPIRLIALDLRGRGDSDQPKSPYHVASSAADIVGLLDALKINEPINYIGHSLGAHIGTYFASHYPERTRRLILIDGGARLPADVAQSVATSRNRVGKVFPSYEAYIAPMQASGIFREWTENIDRAYRYDCEPKADGVGSKVSKTGLDQEWDNLEGFYQEVDDYYPHISAPTLILRAPEPVAAGLSPFLSEEILQIMQDKIAGGAEVLNVPGTNHYTIILQPSPEMLAEILSNTTPE